MSKQPRNSRNIVAVLLACGSLVACKPKFLDFDNSPPPPIDEEQRPDCLAGTDWLPSTPAVTTEQPATHPAPECPFYRGGFQNFLIATQPDPVTGEAALTTYPTVDDLFQKSTPLPAGALAPAGAHRGTALRAWLGDIKQPGGRQILIDQDGHTLYYGIHVNQAFADFVAANGLRTRQAVIDADPGLTFPPGVVTMQSAWKDIDPADGVAGDYSSYITTTAWVSRLAQAADGLITENKNAPRQIRVALVALHVAYALGGHSELVWTSFEHVDGAGKPDAAPVATTNPNDDDPLNQSMSAPAGLDDLLLYRGGTPFNLSNLPFRESDLMVDGTTQSVRPVPNPSLGSLQAPSIYRMFPGSRSHTDRPDPEVVSLNRNVATLFEQNAGALAAADKRGHYRLVGGVWLEKAEYFNVDATLQNDRTSPFVVGTGPITVPLDQYITDIKLHGTDSLFSILGGEDRLSGVATESFTQPPGSFYNCFGCHNTQATTSNGIPSVRDNIPGRVELLGAKRIGVSHVFSAFLLDEYIAAQTPAP